jgi:hypothetical protein
VVSSQDLSRSVHYIYNIGVLTVNI